MAFKKLFHASRIVGSTGTPNDLKASQQLLAAATKEVQASLVSTFEEAQTEITKEIARLKTNELVTEHAEAAKARVEKILASLKSSSEEKCAALAEIGVVQGKLQGELRDINAETRRVHLNAMIEALTALGLTRWSGTSEVRMMLTETAKTSLLELRVSADAEHYESRFLKKPVKINPSDRALDGAYIVLPSRRVKMPHSTNARVRDALEEAVFKALYAKCPKGTRAFELAQGDARNVERLVNQMLGNITTAIDAAEDNVKRQLSMAETRARTRPDGEQTEEEKTTVTRTKPKPSGFVYRPASSLANGTLSEKEADELASVDRKGVSSLIRESEHQIEFMRRRYVIGRREQDVLRQKTLAELAKNEAAGANMHVATRNLIESLMRDGIVAFQDKSGRRWSLGHYCEMATRTGARQSINVGELYGDPEHDLYYIVPRGSRCPVCSKYEGRVYSRSGKNPNYPPLAKAFGKIDPNGPDTIENTYVSIHPNCRHALAKWYEKGKKPEEIERMRKTSNQSFDVERRTKKQVEEYKEKERMNALHHAARRRFKEIADILGFKRTGAFPTFERHYIEKDGWYKKIEAEFEEAVRKNTKQ